MDVGGVRWLLVAGGGLGKKERKCYNFNFNFFWGDPKNVELMFSILTNQSDMLCRDGVSTHNPYCMYRTLTRF